MGIHEKINEKIGIVKTDTTKLLPIDYCIKNYRDLIEDSIIYGAVNSEGNIPTWVDENHIFRKTMAFIFDINPKNSSAIAHDCYQYRCRNVANMSLIEIYKFESKKFFQKCLDYPNYFNLK